MLNRIKIATKIPLFIVISALLSCAAAGLIAILIATQQFQVLTEDKLRALAGLHQASLREHLHHTEEQAMRLAKDPLTLVAFEDLRVGSLAEDRELYDAAERRHRRYFERLLENRHYQDILLIDKEGHILYSTRAKGRPTTDSLSAEAQTTLANLYRDSVIEPTRNRFEGFSAAGVGYLTTALMIDDTYIGMLVIALPIEHVNKILARYEGLSEKGDIQLIGADGRAQSHVRNPYNSSDIAINVPLEFLGTEWNVRMYEDRGVVWAPVKTMCIQIAIASFFGLFGICIMGRLLARTITLPLQTINDTLVAISKNDHKATITHGDRADEIGDLARAALVFKQNTEEKRKLAEEQQTLEARSREDRVKSRAELADRFEMRVQTIIQTVASAALQLNHTAESMGTVIDSMNSKATNVSDSAELASHNVQSVAAAVEEMSATTKEIAQQIVKSSSAVKGAVEQVHKADTTSDHLEKATRSIGEIVVLIQSIAKQINLLALNATIESARAGEAGKGFAVVASEVKMLATQTAKATEQISHDIQSIQKVSSEVVDALRTVKSSIAYVDEYSSTMAAAVEEQSMATNEIASNMGNAAAGTTRITGDINDVSKATAEASQSAHRVLDSAKMLSQEAEKLNAEVKLFLSELRQG